MKKTASALVYLIICTSLYPVNAMAAKAEESLVRAKIGVQIESNDKTFRAKSRDRLKAGDYIRIYVYPEKQAYVYVVHTDGK